MKITYRGTFNTKDKDRLKTFLQLVDKVDIDETDILSSYYISNDSINFNLYRETLKKYKLRAPIDCKISFTKSEVKNVKYWQIRSTWRNGYPADEDSYLKDHFGKTENSTCDCKLNLTQPVTIKKIPNLKDSHFFQLFWLESILFCSSKVKDVLEKHSISGVEILPTYKGKKEKELVKGIYQLKVTEKTMFNRLLYKNEFRYMEICKECGSFKVYSAWDGIIRYDIDEFDVTNDIFYSNDIFNSESIIISTKLKDVLEQEGLTKGLDIQPVFLKGQDHILGDLKQLDYNDDEKRILEDMLNDRDIPKEYKSKIHETQIRDYNKYIEVVHNTIRHKD